MYGLVCVLLMTDRDSPCAIHTYSRVARVLCILQYSKSSQQQYPLDLLQSMHTVLASRVLYVVYESIMHNKHTTVRVVSSMHNISYALAESNSGVLHTLRSQSSSNSFWRPTTLEYMHRLYIMYTLGSILCTYIIYSTYSRIMHKRHAKKQREQVIFSCFWEHYYSRVCTHNRMCPCMGWFVYF